MANNCYNWIQMYGDNLTDANKMIEEAMKVNRQGYGWLPSDREFNHLSYVHFFFSIEDYDKGDNPSRFMCWTKWSPPIEELKIISTMHPNVKFYMQWEECGMELYGRCVIKDGVILHRIDLTDEEVNRVQYDEDSGMYLFTKDDGTIEYCESDTVIYEELLDDKETW
jgi:hypothetical protein